MNVLHISSWGGAFQWGKRRLRSNIRLLIKVRASVRNFDVDMPVNTIRAWAIGLFLCTVGSAVNMLLSLRNPSISLTTFVIQLIAYPVGLLWDLVFPDRVWNVFGLKFNLKPGPFNFKEHVIIVVMSNVGRLTDTYRWLLTLEGFRLRTVAALCIRVMLSSHRKCGTIRTLAGHGSCCLRLRHSALGMGWLGWLGDSSYGLPP